MFGTKAEEGWTIPLRFYGGWWITEDWARQQANEWAAAEPHVTDWRLGTVEVLDWSAVVNVTIWTH
jgi:hypothetical protein